MTVLINIAGYFAVFVVKIGIFKTGLCNRLNNACILLVLNYYLLEDRCIADVIINFISLILYPENK